MIAGSADETRTDYDPSILSSEEAKVAAEQLGGELGRQGCRLVVYSSAPAFIEGEVVRGFAATAPKNREGAVQVRFPLGEKAAKFPEAAAHSKLFEYRADSNTEWESSFFQSLCEADGVVLIGGGRSVLVTGHIALGYRIPLLALPQFGGASQTIWRRLRPGHDLLTEEEKQIVGSPVWNRSSAADCVRILVAQHTRRQAELLDASVREQAAERRLTLYASIAILLFIAAVTIVPVGLDQNIGDRYFLALLYLSGPLAGAAGSTIRSVWNPSALDRIIVRTIALGVVAGGVSALLFLLARLSSGAAANSKQPIALLFSVAIGFIAGFTSDRVYKKLADADVAQLGQSKNPRVRD